LCDTLLLSGWVGGIITLLVFYAITLWSSLLLTECHETGGMKHPTYRSAVLHILGEPGVHHPAVAAFRDVTVADWADWGGRVYLWSDVDAWACILAPLNVQACMLQPTTQQIVRGLLI
jgi:hypothetical protein